MQIGIGIGIGFGRSTGSAATLEDIEAGFNFPAQDVNGWSTFTPAADSRLVYVSDTDGDDGTGAYHLPADAEIGADPLNPVGAVNAYKTIPAALADIRNGGAFAGYPDWLILKRGDTFTITSTISMVNGRGLDERMLITSYGASTVRPVIQTGTVDALKFWKWIKYVAIIGIKFYAHTRDPANGDFAGFGSVGVPKCFDAYNELTGAGEARSVLVEDCYIDFYAGSNFYGSSGVGWSDIIFRRNIITNNYSETTHSSGLFASGAALLLEDNLLDHNGWYKQSVLGTNVKDEGQATIYNHNTYFEDCHDSIIRNNLYLRGSSMNAKFTSNPDGPADSVVSENIFVENNLMVEAEIGVGIGGNDDHGTGYRWRNCHVDENVILNVGEAQPTKRTLAWGVEVYDWDTGTVNNNVIAHYGDATVNNTFGLKLAGHLRSLAVSGNVIADIGGDGSGDKGLLIDSSPKSGVTITSNEIQLLGHDTICVDTDDTSVRFTGNTYQTGLTDPFVINDIAQDFTEWQAGTTSSGESVSTITYTDDSRDVPTYMTSLGETATLDAFIVKCKEQGKSNWLTNYTAASVNTYIKAGFDK